MSQLLFCMLTFTVRLYVYFGISYLLQYKDHPHPRTEWLQTTTQSFSHICAWTRPSSWVSLLWAPHSPGSFTPQLCSRKADAEAQVNPLSTSHWPKQVTWPGPGFTRWSSFPLGEIRSGKVTVPAGVYMGRETSVANFCPLPHLSLIKPFGFTNVVSPGFEIHPVAVSKLRSSVPIQALLQRKI